MKTCPRIIVVIVGNNPPTFKQCLTSVLLQKGQEYKVIILDDASESRLEPKAGRVLKNRLLFSVRSDQRVGKGGVVPESAQND
jgi:glycosyltransferase involved in cell wall biosynthesis